MTFEKEPAGLFDQFRVVYLLGYASFILLRSSFIPTWLFPVEFCIDLPESTRAGQERALRWALGSFNLTLILGPSLDFLFILLLMHIHLMLVIRIQLLHLELPNLYLFQESIYHKTADKWPKCYFIEFLYLLVEVVEVFVLLTSVIVLLTCLILKRPQRVSNDSYICIRPWYCTNGTS